MPNTNRLGPEPLEIFLGDLHEGGKTSVAPRHAMVGKAQSWLLSRWNRTVEMVKTEARGKYVILRIGGDLVEGVRHHRFDLPWGSLREQRQAAVELLMPYVNMAGAIYGVGGTEAHTGAESEDDKTVYDMLGIKQGGRGKIIISETEGQRLNWAHHGLTIGRNAWGRSAALLREIERQYWRNLKHNRPQPDAIVRHHVHISEDIVSAHGIMCAACPCWQLSTAWYEGKDPDDTPTIGILVWWPRRKHMEIWSHEIPEELRAG